MSLLFDDKELTIEDVRPSIKKFAIKMESQLRYNDEKLPWRMCSLGYLQRRLFEENDELAKEILKVRNEIKTYNTMRNHKMEYLQSSLNYVQQESIDVALVAMMIYDNCLRD